MEKRMKPPHMPSLVNSNFDPEYVRESSTMTESTKKLQMLNQDQFEESKRKTLQR